MERVIKKHKLDAVAKIREKLANNQSVVVFAYHGVSANELNALRRKLQENAIEMVVFKNTFVKKAVDENNYPAEFKSILEGPNAFALASKNEIAATKIIALAQEMKLKLTPDSFRGGLADKKFLDHNDIVRFSAISNKEDMIAILLSCLQAPIRNLAYSLQQVADEKPNSK